MLYALRNNPRNKIDLLSNLRSSWLTNAGDTVDERIIVAPDGRAAVSRNSQNIYPRWKGYNINR